MPGRRYGAPDRWGKCGDASGNPYEYPTHPSLKRKNTEPEATPKPVPDDDAGRDEYDTASEVEYADASSEPDESDTARATSPDPDDDRTTTVMFATIVQYGSYEMMTAGDGDRGQKAAE